MSKRNQLPEPIGAVSGDREPVRLGEAFEELLHGKVNVSSGVRTSQAVGQGVARGMIPKQGLSLLDRDYSQAQRTMRSEMEGMVDERQVEDDSQVALQAHQIINTFDLVLTLGQWQVVQSMVEAGIRAGRGKH